MSETTTKKPKVKPTGKNGNIFNLIGIACRALKQAGQEDKAKEMTDTVFMCGSYEEALNVIRNYCEVS